MQYNFYNSETDREIAWEVEYQIEPYESGNRNGHPDSWSAPSGGGFHQLDVYDENREDITDSLPAGVLKDIKKKCYQDSKEMAV